MILTVTPPYKNPFAGDASIFLAGSIEMGVAEDWQTAMIRRMEDEYCGDMPTKDIVVYNPRRDDWDSSWEQKLENPKFNEQVNWELDHLAKADVIAMFFQEGTKSPISLLELGLFAHRSTGMVVYCPEGFWRKGNVDIVCQRHGVPVFTNRATWSNNVIDALNRV
jgi:hypothetical protein